MLEALTPKQWYLEMSLLEGYQVSMTLIMTYRLNNNRRGKGSRSDSQVFVSEWENKVMDIKSDKRCLWNVDPEKREFRGYEGGGPSDGISALVSRGRDVRAVCFHTHTPGKGCLNRPQEEGCL